MSTDQTPTTNRRPNYLVAAAPMLWAVLILFHPDAGGDHTLDGIDDVVDRWLIVHVGQLILTPLLFLAVWRLLDGLTATAATVSRCALVVWTVFFSAYDAIQGIATGLLVQHADTVPQAQQTAIAEAPRLPSSLSMPPRRRHLGDTNGGRRSLADRRHRRRHRLHQARAGTGRSALTAVSVVFSMHMSPAAIGLLTLTGAVVLRERQRADARHLPPQPRR